MTEAALASDFLDQLLRQIRAHDTYGAWEGKSDTEVLGPFIITKEQRREIPIIGDPDPDVLWRIEMFHNAIGLAVERRTGIVASPMMKISHEGFGRVLLTAGRLVVISRFMRDVHRFGYETVEKLSDAGQALVDEAVDWIEKYPEVAKG